MEVILKALKQTGESLSKKIKIKIKKQERETEGAKMTSGTAAAG